MFVLAFFALVLGFTNACLEGQCRCYEKLGLIDCSHSGLYSIPYTNSPLENYSSILLRDNKLQHLNFSSLLEVFPQVILLDVRDNSPLLCEDIKRFYPSKSITVISDCTYPTTEIPGNTVTEIPVTSTKPATHRQHYTYTSNIERNRGDHKELINTRNHNHSITYLYVLIATLLFIPAGIILLRSIVRLFKSRWSRQLPQRVDIELSALQVELLEEDEDVIFSRTSEI